ncbi:MAG: AMP-binding protein [Omnitrophica WOR_2 bacterium]
MIDTVFRSLEKDYAEIPQQVAIHLLFSQQPAKTLTFAELIQGAAGYSQALARADIAPGEVVILILEHGEALIEAFFGAVLHGAIPSIMPFLTKKLAPDAYRASLSALFEITRPGAVITYPEFLDEVRQASQGSSPRTILLCDQVSGAASPDFATLGGRQRRAQDILLLQHSSGTTGLQKGVALSHQAVFNQLEPYAEAIQLGPKDVIVSWLPLYHDMGLIAGFIMPVLKRVPLVLLSPFDWVRAPYRLMQAVTEYGGTLCWLPNFAYNFCAQKIRDRDLQGVNLSSLRAVINCSEPMHWSSHEMFRQRFEPYGLNPAALSTCYAMAENVFAVTQGGVHAPVSLDCIDSHVLLDHQVAEPCQDSQQAIKMVSAGRPLKNTRLRILDPQGADQPERHIGEIALQSDCMLAGYYHRPDLTGKAFQDGWYLTGDLGYLANGELYITGRKKDLIIVGGKNIYPQDLERLANEIPGIHPGRVAAFGVFDERAGTEEVVLVAEAEHSTLLDPQAVARLADEIRRRITAGSDIALRYVEIVEKNWLVKTSSGKIARQANREKYLSEFRGNR